MILTFFSRTLKSGGKWYGSSNLISTHVVYPSLATISNILQNIRITYLGYMRKLILKDRRQVIIYFVFITMVPISGCWVEYPIIWYIQISILYDNLEYNGGDAISFLQSFKNQYGNTYHFLNKKKTNYLSYATTLEF